MSRWVTTTLAAVAVTCATVGATGRQQDGRDPGELLMEYVGNVVNGSPSPSSSKQFGNLLSVASADGSTAFTFYTEATTTRTVVNGPLRVVDRIGTTTIYQASAAGSFDDPDSFKAGTPVQVSTLRQQVIVDTTTGLFTVVNVNTITWSRETTGGGDTLGLGRNGQSFRSMLTGHLNTQGSSPSGWFSGYATK